MSRTPRTRRLQALVLAAQLLGVGWLAFSPAPPPQADLGWDKANHALAFAVMSATADGLARRATVVTGLLGYGIGIELVQGQLPTRSAELADVLADAVGTLLGLGLVTTLRATGSSARRRPPPPP